MIVLKATQDKVLAVLQSVSGIVERRHTLPILANVLIRKTGNALQLTTSDLEIQIRTTAQLDGDEGNYAITVGAKKLGDILKSLPSDQIVSLTANQTKLSGGPVEGPLFDFAPTANEYLRTHLFGDIFERDNLDWQSRELATVAALAEQKREELGANIPIVGTGHLFTAGGQTVDGDGVRELYVGSLAHVTAGIFPACFNYLALGHLHIPQEVNGSKTIRYSGSPLPMGFGEAKQQKSVCQVEFHSTAASVQLIDVPVFQKLERVKGDWDGISSRILELTATDDPNRRAWLEVIYDGIEVIGDLRERLEAAISGTQMEILRIKNNRIIDRVLGQIHEEETLDDLNVNDVFERCLAVHDVPEEQRPELLRAYQETVSSLYEDDVQAE